MFEAENIPQNATVPQWKSVDAKIKMECVKR